ncbi:alpha/beta hydrolase [Actinoplanes sp. NPDC049802]|uniref:alpha/beta hydrolase n=1 Tax=Actinoplanes sp. NPDC049802 TaxID=3154742 RepID=UPI0033D78705
MPRLPVTSRRAVLATSLTGLALLGGSVLGPAQQAPPASPVGVAGWLADPLAPPDPFTATPAEVAAFFARLAPADAAALTHRFPEITGNLDGTPTALRYTANGIRAPHSTPRQILGFDNRADGLMVEVLGDLDTADRVMILVPGVNTDLAGFDTGLGDVQRRAPAWQARQVHDRVQATAPGARVAVIAWLGYDTPEGVGAAAVREDRAAAGALALQRFVQGLLLADAGRSIVVVGHSYGSIVAGLAAPGLPAQVTDIVALGSPGMGVPERSGLNTSARVWACASPNDWIRRVPGVRVLGLGHGTLPSDPEFGALPLPCGDVDGHDGYFEPHTAALQAIAELARALPAGDPR